MAPAPFHLKPEMFRDITDARTFNRGEGYYLADQVGPISEHNDVVIATVRGTYPYLVKLWFEDDRLRYSCTCPIGEDGILCKHCVALGLAWIGGEKPKESEPDRLQTTTTLEDVRKHLQSQEKNALVEMLMEQAQEDERLMRRLRVQAALKATAGVDTATYRQVIDEAVNPSGFVGYREAFDYSRGIEEAIAGLRDLLAAGHAPEAVELTEYALKAVERAMGSIDDSDGYMGAILEGWQDLHLQACLQTRPDPKELAQRLFQWELGSEWGVFSGAAETYTDILGDQGLAQYRKLAEAEWAKVPPLGPGQDNSQRYTERFRITKMMETLARQSGEVEELVTVKARDLSLAYDFLKIAEIYVQAGKPKTALEWAERGLKAFPEHTDSRLRDFLAEEYHRLDRHDEAMALMWAEYTDSPRLTQFEKLKAHANSGGRWREWREKAFDHLRGTLAAAMSNARNDRWAWARAIDRSEIVRILLWEDNIEAAWQEAGEGGCSADLWLELAARREKDHPEDALPIYQRQVERVLDKKNIDAYREAVRLLRKVQNLMERLGRKRDFPHLLDNVRTEHRAKRNFMKLLAQANWG